MSAPADVVTRRGTLRSRVALIRTFAVRDLKARFTATSLGLLWALIVPLATVLIYSTVFSVIFRAQAPPMGNGHAGVFAVWFFCGLVPWNMFSQSVGSGLGSIVGMGAMLQKVYIPSYVPVLSATTTVISEKLLETVVMLGFLLVFLNVGWTWVLFPLVIAGIAVFAASVGYLLAVANVHFRDTGQIFAIVLQLWFFLTPIMYPVDMVPAEWNGLPLQTLIGLNPMTQFVNIARDLLYGLQLPSAGSVAYAAVSTAVVCAAATGVYRRWGRDVAEAI
jgi:ABC-type polysaccharide/polyol phosphate export permease